MNFHDRSELSESNWYDRLKQKGGHQENRDDCVVLSLKKNPPEETFPLGKTSARFSPRLHRPLNGIKTEVAVWW